ncbi:MAG: glutamate racemase [bacterium]
MSDNRSIGVFDSGVGGLTVVHEIFKRLPDEGIVYFGDTARVPYGTKSPKIVETFALQDIFFLLKQNVKILVAACHTVSSTVLESLIQTMHLPMLGVVEPGVKAALSITRNNRIGVIGTRATIMSGTYERKLTEKREGITVVSQACPLFVPLAEEGWLDGDVTRRVAQIYLKPLLEKRIDTLILGCTHYPLLKGILHDIMGEDVFIIDSAEETAKLVADRLHALRLRKEDGLKPSHAFYVSDIPYQFQEVGERFLGMTLESVTRVDLETMYLEEKGVLGRRFR